MNLNLPKDMDQTTHDYYQTVIENIRESSIKQRGKILGPFGELVWEEPLEDYNKRMEELGE